MGDFFVTSEVTFATLQELVSYHQLHAHDLCCRLTSPCLRNEQLHANLETNRDEINLVKLREDGHFSESWEGL